MIQKVLRFLKTYWLCFLLCGIMAFGFLFSWFNHDIYETGSWLSLNFFALFCIYAWPSCSFLYGCITYFKTRKVWIPFLILVSVTFSYIFSVNFVLSATRHVIGSGEMVLLWALRGAWNGAVLFVAISSVFSLIGTGLAAFVVRFCQAWKKIGKMRGFTMKQKGLSKCWFCVLLCLPMCVGCFFAEVYKGMHPGSSGSLYFDLSDYFYIFGIPFLSLIYGCVSYYVLKKVWVPQVILFFVTLIYLVVFMAPVGKIFIAALSTAFSLIGTGLTALVLHLFRAWKEAWKDDPKSDPEVEPIDETN